MRWRRERGADEAHLRHCAPDTWYSLTALVDEGTGLPSDNMDGAGARAPFTSPTDIGCYLWGVVAAHQLGFIAEREVVSPGRSRAGHSRSA